MTRLAGLPRTALLVSLIGAAATAQPVSVKGAVPAAGGTRTYQIWYRNAPVFCTASTLNLSNGHEIIWGP